MIVSDVHFQPILIYMNPLFLVDHLQLNKSTNCKSINIGSKNNKSFFSTQKFICAILAHHLIIHHTLHMLF